MQKMKWSEGHAKMTMLGISLVVLLVLFGVSVANSSDVCMNNAQLGLNLTWWIGVNNLAAFVLVAMVTSKVNPMYIVFYVGVLFVPWHIVGFIIGVTSQITCLTGWHAVGVTAAIIFIVDVVLVLLSLAMFFRPAPHAYDTVRATKPFWQKRAFYLALFIGVSSLIAMSLGSANLSDSCLTPNSTGINLAQWTVVIGTVTFGLFCVLAVTGTIANARTMCKQTAMERGLDGCVRASDAITVIVTVLWVVFLVVWIPLGLFLAASTQAACITGGHSAVTAGFFFSLLLPITAVITIDAYTKQMWAFDAQAASQIP